MVNNNVILDIQKLRIAFDSNVIHDDLNLQVMEGEVLVLLGASGSGKSTLLRSLIGLVKPKDGHCFFENKDIFDHSEKEWTEVRKKIAYAFQGGALFDSMTVEGNLAYPLREHCKLTESEMRSRISETLDGLRLSGTEKLLPSSLSGGMQKRVGLARAIMLNPKLILYDEPTAGLDPQNSKMIAETILELQKLGKTSILVTHDTATAEVVATRLAFIHNRKISALQTIEEFKTKPAPLLASYFSGSEVL